MHKYVQLYMIGFVLNHVHSKHQQIEVKVNNMYHVPTYHGTCLSNLSIKATIVMNDSVITRQFFFEKFDLVQKIQGHICS